MPAICAGAVESGGVRWLKPVAMASSTSSENRSSAPLLTMAAHALAASGPSAPGKPLTDSANFW